MVAVASPPLFEAIPLRRCSVDLAARLARAFGALERQARDRGVGFDVRCSSDLPPVTVDADKLTWAVTALVGNALRYVAPGSRLRAGGYVAVEASAEAGNLRITITDNGPGMPDTAVAAFEGGGDPEGAAPALALINDIVVAHGGHVEVSTSTDVFAHGTKLTLVIPRR
jgi:nitrogen-specific signal transduction histidine kinase